MIFATVGTQLPFDRLLTGLDRWAKHNSHVPVFAQCGESAAKVTSIETASMLGMSEFHRRFQAASLIVAHAGMGTILTAAELGKPVILMPRRARFGEHRNNHQQDTAREMSRLSNVTVVQDQDGLHNALDLAMSGQTGGAHCAGVPQAAELAPLIEVIREFVWADASEKAVDTSQRRRSAA
ncbi:glycosyltransferase [Aliisedimentitalea scapharcae]|uniref:Glycosyltransferase n=1 Tax=Aliisedimentitalea scapharcae TaxID=1524259 RepID=A0ABZ2XUV6_9RHOB